MPKTTLTYCSIEILIDSDLLNDKGHQLQSTTNHQTFKNWPVKYTKSEFKMRERNRKDAWRDEIIEKFYDESSFLGPVWSENLINIKTPTAKLQRKIINFVRLTPRRKTKITSAAAGCGKFAATQLQR